MNNITIQNAFDNIVRNWLTTIPTVLVMALILTMFHGLFIIHEKMNHTLKMIQDKFSITVYFRDDADPFEIGNLITELEQRSDVKKPVIYTSKEAAWQIINKTFSLDNELLKKYKFSLPASLTIALRDLESVHSIETFLQNRAGHFLKDPLLSKEKQKNLTQQMAEFIDNIKKSTLRIIFFFTLIFVIGGALLISSTIHMALTARHREISIMKLVGASRAAITTPLVIEGFLLSIMAFSIHIMLLAMLPWESGKTQWHGNVLLFEFTAIAILSITVSYLTTSYNFNKK